MLAATVRSAVQQRGAVLALAVILTVYGSYVLSQTGLDVFPEFSPKQVVVQTEAPGYTTEQVERLVTVPIERALLGLVGLEDLRSESIQGLSVVTAVFAESSNRFRIRQLVAERLAGIAEILPDGVAAPVPGPMASSSATVRTLGLVAPGLSRAEILDLVHVTVVPRLLSVPGVADVNVFGAPRRELQIQVSPRALQRLRLGLDEVLQSSRGLGAGVGLGTMDTTNQRFTVTMAESIDPVSYLSELVIRGNLQPALRVGDLAEVVDGTGPTVSAAAVNADPGVVLMVIGQFGANTRTVSAAIDEAMAELEPALAGRDVVLHDLFRPARYIEDSLKNLGEHLLVGGALVLAVLLLFLFNLRTALISATAIPLSLIGAALAMIGTGFNLNIMIIGGLAIALGEVVDDAIIDTENIARRLRQNQLGGKPKPPLQVVYDASMEVRSSVVYASFIVALVFTPLLVMGGVAGRLFAPMGLAYIFAILLSLVVALTVTPALCALALAGQPTAQVDPPFIRVLRGPFKALLLWVNRHFSAAIGLVMGLVLAGLAGLPALGGGFLPELREGHYMVHTASVAGTSLEGSLRIGSGLVAQFNAIPGVRSVSQWAGRAERGADTFGTHYSEYEVDLERLSGGEQQEVLDALRESLAQTPGIAFEANTFLTERIDETVSGYASPLVINLYGPELNVLDGLAAEVAEVLATLPGVVDVQLRSPPGLPEIEVVPDVASLARNGLKPRAVSDVVRAAVAGERVGVITQDGRGIPVRLRLRQEEFRGPLDIAEIPIKNAFGGLVRLGDVASVREIEGRYNILHLRAQRVQTVTANATDADTAGLLRRAQAAIESAVVFPAGYYPQYTGAAVEQGKVKRRLLVNALLASAGVLLFIYIAIGSLRNMLLVIVNLPFSLVGGLVAVFVTNAAVSVGTMVGFITLFGITVRNSIMLVSHYRYLVQEEGRQWNIETALSGAQERLPSILMTATVTALAMLPIALDSDNPGREIMGPMAAIIIGGLVSSTCLNLLLLPAVMLRFGRFNRVPVRVLTT